MVLLPQEIARVLPLPWAQHQHGRVMGFGDASGEMQQDGGSLTTEVGKPETALQLQAVSAPHCSTEFRSLLKEIKKSLYIFI